ncbi:hypothetical protein ECG_05104 [Echinococcus granulosus]|uniref:G patch domain-containing protein 4 n=1 Tax=Echinococcus granulosus TaxID=6210 RepID=A0A068X1M7_ECHGR|nr:hypothetical protein ECG_05104 [Echinococcus granulosus]CDS24693.1 G patch domain containing protein 4 [Echinococcus granulosus]
MKLHLGVLIWIFTGQRDLTDLSPLFIVEGSSSEDMSSGPSSFAVNQLKKFGWSEGDGLGKNKDGISEPIKASMKFSRRGLGAAYQTTQIDELLWSDVYQEALSRVFVRAGGFDSFSNASIAPKVKFVSSEDALMNKCIESQKGDLVNIDMQPRRICDTSKEVSMSRKREKRKCGERSSVVVDGTSGDLGRCGEVGNGEGKKEPPVVKKFRCLTKVTGEEGVWSEQSSLHSISSTHLLELGNGRTGHPAARFNIRCSGKLARAAQFL